jgi:hypothetical protein
MKMCLAKGFSNQPVTVSAMRRRITLASAGGAALAAGFLSRALGSALGGSLLREKISKNW